MIISLEARIELEKSVLNQLVEQQGTSSPEALQQSRMIDRLILIYYKKTCVDEKVV